jgi:N-acetylmuramoyl-L-alanine amidase
LRFIFIKAYYFKRKYLYLCTFAAISALVLVGLNSVLAINKTSPITSWAVANRVIVIDPGHGGIDPGAVGYNDIKEKDIVLNVSKQLQSLLSHAGAKVYMTRESDIDLSISESGSLLTRKREDLKNRVELANKNKADLYLSIHVNAFPSSQWYGAQTFYQRNQPESKKLAQAVQSELINIMGNTTRVAKPEDFFTTRNTKMAAVIIELGFISNPKEARLLTQKNYQRKLTNAIYRGVVKYYSGQITTPTIPRQ